MSNEKTEKSAKPANNLEVKLSASETNGALVFEASATVPHFARTKFANKEGITKFDSLSTLKGLVRRAAIKYGYEGVTYDEASVQRRVAAKRAATSKKPESTDSAS